MNETFEQQVARVMESSCAVRHGNVVDPTEFARALAAEWFREPANRIEYDKNGTLTVVLTDLYRKPEGL